MRNLTYLFVTFILSTTFILANEQKVQSGIGKVVILKGEATLNRNNTPIKLSKDFIIQEKDKIQTSDKTFLRILLNDKTALGFGPNSSFEFKAAKFTQVSRKLDFSLIHGKMRAIVVKKTSPSDELKFNTKTASVGVRGTEFLTNAYNVQGAPSSDFALLNGKLKTDVSSLNTPIDSFNLQDGQAFNTSQFKASGDLSSVQKLSPESIEALKSNTEAFIPNIQNPDGSFLKLDDAIRKQFGLAANTPATPSAPSATIPTPSIPVVAVGATIGLGGKSTAAKKKKSTVKIQDAKHKALKDEPWDIRDAMMRRKELRFKNECFYWFYKSLPGDGKLERFRRERECNEYEF